MERVTRQAAWCRRRRHARLRYAACGLVLLWAPLALAQNEASRPVQSLPSIELLMRTDPGPSPFGSASWAQAPALPATAPAALRLGLRWRPPPVAGQHLNAQVWRRISLAHERTDGLEDEPLYGARLEMQLSSPKLRLRDLLGVQLDNGARLSLGRINGRVSVYYRMQF